MASLFPLPGSRRRRRDPRLARGPKMPLKHRLRAALRALADLIESLWTWRRERQARARRREALRLAAHEAQTRAEAIDSSVGAMSAADIQRVLNKSPDPPP